MFPITGTALRNTALRSLLHTASCTRAASVCTDMPCEDFSADYCPVIFVLGPPGTGKSSQCRILDNGTSFLHLNAGDLLRRQARSEADSMIEGTPISKMLLEGDVVPSYVTIGLLAQTMAKHRNPHAFLLDGFPRNMENVQGWNESGARQCDLVLNFFAPDSILEERLLNRKENRSDDNVISIRKRFKTFHTSTQPVLDMYESQGLLENVDASKTPDEMHSDLFKILLRRLPKFMTLRSTFPDV